MAGFSFEQAEQTNSRGGGGFFSIKDDKGVAKIRFLFRDAEEVQNKYARSVHEVTVNGKKRWVDCLRGYGDSVDVCPFCKAGRFVNFKYFLPIYNIDAGTTQIWERGKKFGGKISSICSRYPNIVSHTFDIERCGKAGDQQTTYEIYETGETQGVSVEDFDFQNPIGTLVMLKSAEDMQYYLDHKGVFPGGDNQSYSNDSEPEYTRRTPAGGSGRNRVF